MIRKQQKRAARGKQTAFRVNGQDVDPKRIARFVRRYGSSWNRQKDKEVEMQSPEPSAYHPAGFGYDRRIQLNHTATPSDMSCYTPEPEEAATPISPPEIQSPARETSTYPLHYGTYPSTYTSNTADDIQIPLTSNPSPTSSWTKNSSNNNNTTLLTYTPTDPHHSHSHEHTTTRQSHSCTH